MLKAGKHHSVNRPRLSSCGCAEAAKRLIEKAGVEGDTRVCARLCRVFASAVADYLTGIVAASYNPFYGVTTT